MADPLQLIADIGASRRQKQFTEETNQKAMDYNDRMFNLTNERAAQAWERENAYNHPKQQMNRLRQAGINPHTVMGKGADATAGTLHIGSSSNPGLSNNMSGPRMNTGSNSLLEFAQIKNLQAETDQTMQMTKNLEIDNQLKGLDVLGKDTSNKSNLVDYEIKSATRENVIRTAQENMYKAIGQANEAYGRGEYYGRRSFDDNMTAYERQYLQQLENMKKDGSLKAAILNNLKVQKELLDLDKQGLSGNDPYYIKSLIKLLKANDIL